MSAQCRYWFARAVSCCPPSNMPRLRDAPRVVTGLSPRPCQRRLLFARFHHRAHRLAGPRAIRSRPGFRREVGPDIGLRYRLDPLGPSRVWCLFAPRKLRMEQHRPIRPSGCPVAAASLAGSNSITSKAGLRCRICLLWRWVTLRPERAGIQYRRTGRDLGRGGHRSLGAGARTWTMARSADDGSPAGSTDRQLPTRTSGAMTSAAGAVTRAAARTGGSPRTGDPCAATAGSGEPGPRHGRRLKDQRRRGAHRGQRHGRCGRDMAARPGSSSGPSG